MFCSLGVCWFFIYLVFFFFSLSSYEDPNFAWDNAGATLFGAAAPPAAKSKGDEEGSDEDEAPNNLDIHFEPIVSLPEVQLES